MIYDCAIIGGGPAGQNAALVLGRARRSVALLDNNQPRNAVTHASHGYLTRDGITPSEFRRIASEQLKSYPSVEEHVVRVTDIRKLDGGFEVFMESGHSIRSRKLLIATGLKEILPDIPGVKEMYGTSLFHCPYCDGWELRDQPLILMGDDSKVYHLAKLLYQWSRDLVVCTQGQAVLSDEQKRVLADRHIQVTEQTIAAFHGSGGQLREVEFTDGSRIARTGGFIMPERVTQTSFRESLGYEPTELGGIRTDETGKSSVPGLFAAGEAAPGAPSQLIVAAAQGSLAAVSINVELMEEDFGV
ncbi:NAD(P)/FAD-dependent oxidoreductase [Paenibacillus filicis]|uniref:NAD(P)/FAD-dependent oxidoreductase n=1 Tax=Paenibacillus filicis TaxID=669464 RepID=A0ABU9DJ35_9BACL